MTLKDISKRILKIRNSKGFSQQKISEIMCIGQSFLAEIEKEKTLPGVKFFLSAYEYLNINTNWLLTGAGDVYVVKSKLIKKATETFGQRLKVLRKTLKITQLDMSRKTKITQGFLSSAESDRYTVGAEFLYELNQQFNVNINWLLSGEGDMFLDQPGQQQESTDQKPEIVLKIEKLISDTDAFSPEQVAIVRKILEIELSSSPPERTSYPKLEMFEKMLIMWKDMTDEQTKEMLKYISQQEQSIKLRNKLKKPDENDNNGNGLKRA